MVVYHDLPEVNINLNFAADVSSFIVIEASIRQLHKAKLGIEQVEALADISRSAMCCHSTETRAPIANSPNSAQLEGTPNYSPSYIRVRAVAWECAEGETQTAVANIHISRHLRLTPNVKK